jgi:two-component sensor histidine kinase
LLEMGIRSVLLTPLNSKGEVIGTLGLSSRRIGAYGPRERAILERLAHLIAPAVANAQLYEETRIEKERAAAARDQLKTVLEGLEAGKEALRREMLLKEEIHHRVKNNLQVISSLLYLQSTNVTDQTTRDILRESRSRIKSIALVHEKLHLSEDSERLDFTEYATDLLTDLFVTYGAYQRGIMVHTQIKDIFLGIDTAIPCGLIINELVSNPLKHAFADGMRGEEWIELRQLRDKTYALVVRDNGVGLPQGFSVESAKSLGLKLVRDLTQQLDGKMKIETGNGAMFHIAFKELLYKERW